jgi:hypothetical protein
MREFFQGWRRKVGVVTLLMALVLCGLWVRSLSTIDVLALPASLLNYTFVSGQGSFAATGNFVFNLRQDSREENGRTILRVEIRQMAKQPNRKEFHWWKFNGSEFRLFRSSSESNGVMPMVPYWSLVLPLTLLSAYLILWKPRTTKLSDQPAISNLISN